jgi:hypothetical protein
MLELLPNKEKNAFEPSILIHILHGTAITSEMFTAFLFLLLYSALLTLQSEV